MTCKKIKNNIILLLVIIYTFLTCSQTCKASWSTEQIDFVKSKLEIRVSKVIGKGKLNSQKVPYYSMEPFIILDKLSCFVSILTCFYGGDSGIRTRVRFLSN